MKDPKMQYRFAVVRGAVCAAAAFAALAAKAEIEFDAGADLRIRQEMMKNVPGLPGGGLIGPYPRTGFINHMRFRPRVWGQVSGITESEVEWRLFARLADEFRWCPEPHRDTHTFPDEVIPDNLFVEGKGLFDGLLDLKIGRQDL